MHCWLRSFDFCFGRAFGLDFACSDAGSQSKLQRNRERVDARILPPNNFVSKVVNIAMVTAAQWNRVFVAHLAAERAGLRKAEICGSEGFRPQTRQGCESTNFRWASLEKSGHYFRQAPSRSGDRNWRNR
jgi:hypothetical protein